MSIQSINRLLIPDYVPHIRFSEKNRQELIWYAKLPIHPYISPKELTKHIKEAAEQIDFSKYDATLVNMKGGKYFLDRLMALKGRPKDLVEVEYHEPEGGFGAIVVIPVPNRLKGAKVLVVDDIRDTGGTSKKIAEDVAGETHFAFELTKDNIPGQIILPHTIVGIKIDRVWVAGAGLDISTPKNDQFYPKDAFRDYPGIVVRPDDDTLRSLFATKLISS